MKSDEKHDDFHIAKPCDKDWQDLDGDDIERFCTACNKHVHNVSILSREEAQDLMERAKCEGLCVYMKKDADTHETRFDEQERLKPEGRSSLMRLITSLRLKTLAPPALALFLAASAFGVDRLYEEHVVAPLETSGQELVLNTSPCDLQALHSPEDPTHTVKTPIADPPPSTDDIVPMLGEPPAVEMNEGETDEEETTDAPSTKDVELLMGRVVAPEVLERPRERPAKTVLPESRKKKTDEHTETKKKRKKKSRRAARIMGFID